MNIEYTHRRKIEFYLGFKLRLGFRLWLGLRLGLWLGLEQPKFKGKI